MGLSHINISYGANLDSPDGTINVNDDTNYHGRTMGLFATPENTLELADTAYNTPYLNRTKTKERVFSIIVDINAEPYSSGYVTKLSTLATHLYMEDAKGSRLPVRVTVVRAGITDVYIDAVCETFNPIDDIDLRKFQLLFTAVDPYLTRSSGGDTASVSTGSDPTAYPDLTIPVNTGTAPSEPVITFNLSSHGGVYRYYRDITVTNNCDYPLSYYPICIDLGDIRSLVGTKYHEVGGGDQRIRDIRIETIHGTRKILFVRDSGQAGGTWHQSVKLWTILYHLKPGESVVLRVLYDNTAAPVGELDETQNSTVKSMFNMYNSTNALHQYVDFMPAFNKPETRARQWQWYIPGAQNLTWIGYAFNHFDVGPEGNVPCAGGKALYDAPSFGISGLKLHCPVPAAQVYFTYRLSTNNKAPFVLRSVRPDGRIVDDFARPDNLHPLNQTALGNIKFDVGGGDTLFRSDSISRAGATLLVGDIVNIVRNDGGNHRATVTAISVTLGVYEVDFTPAISGGAGVLQASANNEWQQGYADSATVSYTPTDAPNLLVFALRGDSPTNTTGHWYYGAAEFVEITWDSAKMPGVTTWGSATEVDLAATGYHLRGRFGNLELSEYLGINTIVPTLNDKVVIDCKNRTCNYYHWNGSSFDAPQNRMEALAFDTIRRYWIHVIPLVTQHIRFIPNTDSNFTGADVDINVPVRYLN